MTKNTILILLVLLGIVMLVLGYKKDILPPVITGVGFILIAILFKIEKK